MFWHNQMSWWQRRAGGLRCVGVLQMFCTSHIIPGDRVSGGDTEHPAGRALVLPPCLQQEGLGISPCTPGLCFCLSLIRRGGRKREWLIWSFFPAGAKSPHQSRQQIFDHFASSVVQCPANCRLTTATDPGPGYCWRIRTVKTGKQLL